MTNSTTEPARRVAETLSPDEPAIRVSNLRKSFGKARDTFAVDDLSIDVQRGEIVALLGPSGCGKTTTLRCIAGLSSPDSGRITINGRTVFSDAEGINLPPEKRSLSMVFQQYALWPHLSVFRNVAFGLQVRREPKAKVAAAVQQALEHVQLWDHRDRRISQLSGGQQQRVAVARAIAFEPRVILFDEPLSNLDAKLREEMRFQLLALQRDIGFAGLYVTHDQSEAIGLAERVVIMNAGQVEQSGSPREIWRVPATPFVAQFVGSTNRLRGFAEIVDGEHPIAVEVSNTLLVHVDSLAPTSQQETHMSGPVELFFKMSDVVVSAAPESASPATHDARRNRWLGAVSLASFDGDSSILKIDLGGTEVVSRHSGGEEFRVGDSVEVTVSPAAISCFPSS